MIRLLWQRLTGREAAALRHQRDAYAEQAGKKDPCEGPATHTHLTGFAAFFVRTLSGVYPSIRVGSILGGKDTFTACFYFGDSPLLSVAEVLALDIPAGSIRYHGNMVIIVQRDDARLWTREQGVAMADTVFADLMEQGY